MKSLLRLVLVVLVLAGAGIWYFAPADGPLGQMLAPLRGGGKPAGAPATPGGPPGGMAMPVEAGPVKIGVVERRVTAVGSLLSSESVVIRPETAGRIAEISFAEGQPVRQGQVLVKIDDAIQRGVLAQGQASLALSRIEATRADELFRQGTGSAKARDQTQAKLLFDQAELAVAQTRLAKLTLVAPFEGVLGLRKVSIGDYVKEGQDIVNLEAIDPLKVDFQVPEQFLTVVAVGQALAVSLDAVPGRSFAGVVYAIDPLVDVNGRSIRIRARIDNREKVLRPGLFARVVLTLASRTDAILIPEQSVFAIGTDQYVFRIRDGVARQARVKLGDRRNAEVEILEGLERDDVVIWTGQLKLRDGVPVMNVTKTAGN